MRTLAWGKQCPQQPLPALQRTSRNMASGPGAPAPTPAQLRRATASAAAETLQSSFATADVIRAAGYGLEEHTVTTTDGYILRMERIPKLGAWGPSGIKLLRLREHSRCQQQLCMGRLPQLDMQELLEALYVMLCGNMRILAPMDCTLPVGCRDVWHIRMPLLTRSRGRVLAGLAPSTATALHCALLEASKVVWHKCCAAPA